MRPQTASRLACLTKRRISSGPMSESARMASDVMLGLMKTCRKLGISFFAYLSDHLDLNRTAERIPPARSGGLATDVNSQHPGICPRYNTPLPSLQPTIQLRLFPYPLLTRETRCTSAAAIAGLLRGKGTLSGAGTWREDPQVRGSQTAAAPGHATSFA